MIFKLIIGVFNNPSVTLFSISSSSLPQYIVVPESVLDWQLGDAARHFRGGRPPIWCWGTYEGAALVRMADILPTINDRYTLVTHFFIYRCMFNF